MDEYIYSQSVHKDFHGIMSFLIKFIRKKHGARHMDRFFTDAAVYIYRPLIQRIKEKGLQEIKKHFSRVFDAEDGKYRFQKDTEEELVFRVDRCPPIWHMKDSGAVIDERFCHCCTELVNTAIAEECGFRFSVDYDQEKGSCLQRFWRPA